MLQKEQSPKRFPINQSPVLHAKPIAISLSSKIPTSPYMSLRDPQVRYVTLTYFFNYDPTKARKDLKTENFRNYCKSHELYHIATVNRFFMQAEYS